MATIKQVKVNNVNYDLSVKAENIEGTIPSEQLPAEINNAYSRIVSRG